MRNLVPLRGSVVCRKVCGGTTAEVVDGIKVNRTEVDLYRIIRLPLVPSDGLTFKTGDIVMSNSTGDEIEVNPGDIVHLFKIENLMCRVDLQ